MEVGKLFQETTTDMLLRGQNINIWILKTFGIQEFVTVQRIIQQKLFFNPTRLQGNNARSGRHEGIFKIFVELNEIKNLCMLSELIAPKQRQINRRKHLIVNSPNACNSSGLGPKQGWESQSSP